jgi:hypothetical protein
MKKVLFIIIIILFSCGCAKNDQLTQAWNRFWNLTEDNPKPQNQIIQYKDQKTVTLFSKSSIDPIEDDGRVKFQFHKKPFGSDYDEVPYQISPR